KFAIPIDKFQHLARGSSISYATRIYECCNVLIREIIAVKDRRKKRATADGFRDWTLSAGILPKREFMIADENKAQRKWECRLIFVIPEAEHFNRCPREKLRFVE